MSLIISPGGASSPPITKTWVPQHSHYNFLVSTLPFIKSQHLRKGTQQVIIAGIHLVVKDSSLLATRSAIDLPEAVDTFYNIATAGLVFLSADGPVDLDVRPHFVTSYQYDISVWDVAWTHDLMPLAYAPVKDKIQCYYCPVLNQMAMDFHAGRYRGRKEWRDQKDRVRKVKKRGSRATR